MMDVWGVVKHYCPDSFDSAKIFDRGFAEIEAVMRNSPSCLNGLDFNTKLPELSLGMG
ncbi:hypothetical protein [Neisseria sp. Marseille-Q5346]|uniref:hypothetical protein n=1 Tax=unclassified Neisseria TaxID=2623750 RepID=UPI0021E0E24A|nr:hypothetical protein [Neisseria sp. Marseille-Q5346]